MPSARRPVPAGRSAEVPRGRGPVGLNGIERPAFAQGTRRRVTAGLVLVATAVLSGCSGEQVDQWGRAGMPTPATEQTPLIGDLWLWTWIAALGVGVLVWGLILFAAVAYRKRTDDLPPQTRFNMPIEFLYTIPQIGRAHV